MGTIPVPDYYGFWCLHKFGMPTSWRAHVPTVETAESRSGEFFRAVNGQKIFNEGSKIVSLLVKEGVRRDTRFISCEVAKALG